MRSAAAYLHPRDEILQAIQRIYRYRMTTTSGGNLSIREDERRYLDHTRARSTRAACAAKTSSACTPTAQWWDRTAPRPSCLPSGDLRTRPRYSRHRARAPGRAGGIQPGARGARHAPLPPDPPGLRRGRFRALRTAGQPRARDESSPRFSAGATIACSSRITAPSPRGANLQEAFRRFETLEFTAKTIIKARLLGEVRYLTDDEIAIARDAAPEWTAFAAPRTDTPRKGTARAPGRVRAPRLSPAAVHQHAGQFLGARGCARAS